MINEYLSFLSLALATTLVAFVVLYVSYRKLLKRLETTKTELQKSLDSIQKAQSNLSMTAKLCTMGELLASIIHEINNPLMTIGHRTELTKRALSHTIPDIEKAHRNLDGICEMGDRIEKICKGLKALARNDQSDPFIHYPLETILSDALSLVKAYYQFRGVPLKVDCPDMSLKLECRPTQVVQVLVNMLINSLDAIENLEDRWAELKIQGTTEMLTISITDSGHGIPKDLQEKILEPFFTTKPVGKGTGLGLSITRRILEAHNGTLKIDDTCPNTRFVMTLPTIQTRITATA